VDNQGWRKALHGAAVGAWVAALALDARQGKWRAVAAALGLHAAAEIVGQVETPQATISTRQAR
jgi:hypothetical protein